MPIPPHHYLLRDAYTSKWFLYLSPIWALILISPIAIGLFSFFGYFDPLSAENLANLSSEQLIQDHFSRSEPFYIILEEDLQTSIPGRVNTRKSDTILVNITSLNVEESQHVKSITKAFNLYVEKNR